MTTSTTTEPASRPATVPPNEPHNLRILRGIAGFSVLVGLAGSAALAAPLLIGRGFCGPGESCSQVAQSDWSKVLGIPRPFLGLAAFSIAMGLVVARGKWAARLAPLMGLVAFIEGLRLLWIQAFLIRAFCVFCVAIDVSAVVLGLSLVLEFRSRHVPRTMFLPVVGIILALTAIGTPIGLAALRAPTPGRTLATSVGLREGRVVLREFVDLECPFCRATHKALKEALAERPDILVDRKHVPLVNIHEHALTAAMASLCAAEQGREEEFIDALVALDMPPAEDICVAVAKKISIDMTRFEECRKADRTVKHLAADVRLFQETAVEGLPTLDIEFERHTGSLNLPRAKAFLARHPRR